MHIESTKKIKAVTSARKKTRLDKALLLLASSSLDYHPWYLEDLPSPRASHYEKKLPGGVLISFSSTGARQYISLCFQPEMAAVTSLSFSAIGPSADRRAPLSSTRLLGSNFPRGIRFRTSVLCDLAGFRASTSGSCVVVQCMSAASGEQAFCFCAKWSFGSLYKRQWNVPSCYRIGIALILLVSIAVINWLITNLDSFSCFRF